MDLLRANRKDEYGLSLIHISKALAAVGSTGCIMFLVLGFANGIAPVSYTHLDVYKRQQHA